MTTDVDYSDEERKTCSICQRYYTGFGHNAQPVNAGRCCDECNYEVVVRARMALLFRHGGRDGQA